MRTTINLGNDVLLAARGLARRKRTCSGAVVSEPARKGLNGDSYSGAEDANVNFYGFRPLPKRGRPVTSDLIDQLRDEGPY